MPIIHKDPYFQSFLVFNLFGHVILKIQATIDGQAELNEVLHKKYWRAQNA